MQAAPISSVNTPEPAGKIELLLDPDAAFRALAVEYAENAFRKAGRRLDAELPGYVPGLAFARQRASLGRFQRHEMPVIEEDDLPDLKRFVATLGGRVVVDTIKLGDIWPLQRQLYVDRAVDGTARVGRYKTIDFLKTKHVVTDIKGGLIDGHHRWLSACTIDPFLELPRFRIGLPIEDVRTDLLIFSEDKGRVPNA